MFMILCTLIYANIFSSHTKLSLLSTLMLLFHYSYVFCFKVNFLRSLIVTESQHFSSKFLIFVDVKNLENMDQNNHKNTNKCPKGK